MPITDNRTENARRFDEPDRAPFPILCPVHGERPLAAGLPDHPGFSGWGRVQTLRGDWVKCVRCGDCGSVLLVEG